MPQKYGAILSYPLWILLFCLPQNTLSFLWVWKWANGISPISACKNQMLKSLFSFEFFSSGSFWLLSYFLASLLGQLQFSKTILNAFISAIGWKWKGLEKPFEAISRSTSNTLHLGFCKDCCVQAQFDAELTCMLWNSKYVNFHPPSPWY